MLVDGIDLRSLAIGPQEAFVLSRVDGVSSEKQIAAATGLDSESVLDCLSRLHNLGAIAYPGEEPQPTTPAAQQSASPGASEPRGGVQHVSYDASLLDEPADLPNERKHQILQTFFALEEATHYELLGVPPTADKKEIKAAYFRVVNVFHPDRYFGKQLGSFKTKLEQVFARLTEAQDILTRKATRDEYDAYLATKRRTSELDDLLANGNSVAEQVQQAQALIEQTALRDSGAPAFDNNVIPSPPPNGARVDVRQFRPSQQDIRRARDPELRKKALARKLRGSGAPPQRMSGTIPVVHLPPEDQAKFRQSVATNLKARYQARLVAAKQQQIERYLAVADQAEVSKDPVSAMNALKIAAELDPENAELAERLARVQLEATRSMADSYLQQAEYEQREGRLDRAARNYERAAQGTGRPALYDRAASCLLEAQSDLKHAGVLARKAVELAPTHSDYRITLARVYAAAKMLNSAVKEAERAVKLAPQSEAAKDWLKRIKRGES